MLKSAFHKIVFLSITALLTASCGTRTIVVPVTRPASIDAQHCGRIALLPVEIGRGADPLSPLVRDELDAVLLPMLAELGSAQFIPAAADPSASLVTPRGRLALSVAEEAARAVDARCVLACSVMESTYNEDVLEAEIISNRDPGGTKFVREGKASSTFRILLVDLRRREVTFSDTLRLQSTHETDAVNEEPPALDRSVPARNLAQRFASMLAEAMRPHEDRQVVTFLVDDAWPELERMVMLTEQGQWPQAAEIIRDLLDEESADGDRDILWYDLGLTLQYQHDFRAAKDAFERALELRDRRRYHHAMDALHRMEDEYIRHLRQQY